MDRADKRKIKNEDTDEEPEGKKIKIKDEVITLDSDNTPEQEKPTRAKRAAKKPVKLQIISDSDETEDEAGSDAAGSDEDFNLNSDNSEEDFQPKKARIKKEPKPKVKKEPKQRAPRKPKEKAPKKEPKVPKEKAPKKEPKEKVPKEPKAKAPKKESTKIKAPVTNPAIKNEFVWHEIDRLAEKENIDYNVAKALINLFESGDTIPFIARYRKALTNDMPPEKLRDVKDSYEEICACKKKADNIITVIKKSGHFTPTIKDAVLKCKNAEELEYVYAPFKTGQKRTLAERAKQLGLEESALAILRRTKSVNINSLINPKEEGLKNREAVEKGLMHIIAHVITSETETLEFIRKLRSELRMTVESKKVTKEIKSESEKKFENYFDYKISLQYIKPHQTLAMNRGENLKILSVKINVPDYALHQFTNFCYQKYGKWGNQERMNLLKNSIEDAYKRKVHPLIVRQTRAELNVKAEKASVEVFALNLKKLLLITPLKGKAIMGIDPGFKIGCKVAVISPNGDLLDTSVIYPHNASNQKDPAIIRELLRKHNCSLIALGNGTACRETETWLSDLIKSKFFAPLDVSYTIVDECGASIYSCSAEAKKEFKELDPLLISATSLARRVQDPLAEMVKVDPQHLGVGMYQHDVNKKLLENTLNEIVSECVSFVGVDLNTASQCLLRRVAGLTDLRATNILKHRMSHGPFTNRWQIKDVKGVGEKVFEQCAGFLRVAPSDSSDAETFFQRPDTNPLDCTWIHPESYELTEKILEKFGFQVNQVGQPSFISSFSKCLVLNSAKSLAEEFDSTEATVKLILDALQKPFDYDLRNEDNHKPIFRKEVKTLYDISVDMVLTGHVRNVTSFGAFVDIGVGVHGLIHQSAMRGFTVQFGDKVEVKVLKVEIDRQRIGLTVLNVL